MTHPNVTYESLKGCPVVVTGGASGIGEFIVRAFFLQGAHVHFLDIDEVKGRRLESVLLSSDTNNQIHFHHCDLTVEAEIESTFEKIADMTGGISVLCNNAGNDQRHDWTSITFEEWDKVQDHNLKHHFFCTRAAHRHFPSDIGGSVICIGSISYLNGSDEMVGYTTAKSALVGLVNILAKLLGHSGTRVNLVQPGWIMTEKQLDKWINQHALELINREQLISQKINPEEVAKLVLFLASDQAKLITKQVINIDAGWV